ncbi:hypothetical protein DPMN_079231 [Dreissena polymorpha]|uniref:PHD-type domain-containing protein n=1 Tax=Dreissena polymorpha TaxID=45954 RepID=A0A9D4BI74_DREPO|nr:hypothetical protein DPMN_079231 [Dreissena polymorpha]
MADELCISCDRIVSPRQHAITCDLCDRWQHRTCDTGWHHKLNTTVRYGGCSIYVLVPTLMTEAEIVAITVAADDLDRDVATKCTKLEKKIQSLWDKYMGNGVITTHFLKSVSRLYGPSDNMTTDLVVGLSGE